MEHQTNLTLKNLRKLINSDNSNPNTPQSFFCNSQVKDSKKLTSEQMIRYLLRERNWKQTQLADKIGITRQGLNNYLRGYWSFPDSLKVKIAQAFGIDSCLIWGLGARK